MEHCRRQRTVMALARKRAVALSQDAVACALRAMPHRCLCEVAISRDAAPPASTGKAPGLKKVPSRARSAWRKHEMYYLTMCRRSRVPAPAGRRSPPAIPSSTKRRRASQHCGSRECMCEKDADGNAAQQAGFLDDAGMCHPGRFVRWQPPSLGGRETDGAVRRSGGPAVQIRAEVLWAAPGLPRVTRCSHLHGRPKLPRSASPAVRRSGGRPAAVEGHLGPEVRRSGGPDRVPRPPRGHLGPEVRRFGGPAALPAAGGLVPC